MKGPIKEIQDKLDLKYKEKVDEAISIKLEEYADILSKIKINGRLDKEKAQMYIDMLPECKEMTQSFFNAALKAAPIVRMNSQVDFANGVYLSIGVDKAHNKFHEISDDLFPPKNSFPDFIKEGDGGIIVRGSGGSLDEALKDILKTIKNKRRPPEKED